MPNLNKIIKDRDDKKFVKKQYRPWDLTGEESLGNKEKSNLQQLDKTLNIVKDNEIQNLDNIKVSWIVPVILEQAVKLTNILREAYFCNCSSKKT